MQSFVALITVLGDGAGAPGVPTHPIYLPPYPDQGLPGPQPRPEHPIVIPPEAVSPGVPTHPIYLPPGIWPTPGRPPRPDNTLPGNQPYPDQGLPGNQPYPDQGLPGWQPRPDQGLPPFPSHPIVFPPGMPGLPPTPGLPPLIPTHPIVIPPSMPPKAAIVIPLPESDMEPPAGVHPDSSPAIVWFGKGTLPTVAWIPPIASTGPVGPAMGSTTAKPK